MTTIAYDGRYIACESRISSNGHVSSNSIDKFHICDEWILFWSGALHQKDKIIESFITGKDFTEKQESWLMAYEKLTKKVFSISVVENKFTRDHLQWKDGQGSGCCYAIGAMDQGASAIEAVKIAINRDCASGGKINCLDTHTGKFIKVKQ